MPNPNSSAILSINADRLGRAELFSGLPEADLLAIGLFCREEIHREGDTLIVEDQPADTLFVVERGKVALEKKVQIGRHSTPRNATIGYVGPGKVAGFSALAHPHVYSTSGVCVEPTRVIAIDGAALRTYLEENPAAGLKVMDSLSVLISSRYRDSINTLTYFLSIVSHELRTPLAAIENYLRAMMAGFAGDLTPKQERMVKRSILRITDLSAMIGDVVDLARMRPEQIQADFEWFDPGEVGTESIEDARLAAAEKDIHLRIEPPPQFEPIVGARRRIRQVFSNLLNNAIKYAPAGSTVIFRAWYETQAVCFEVEDQGPGIPAEDLPYVFQNFFRASNVGETTGAGLGLSIAQKIMEAHDGQILISNVIQEDGQTGVRITVVIPRNLKTPEMMRREWSDSAGEGSGMVFR